MTRHDIPDAKSIKFDRGVTHATDNVQDAIANTQLDIDAHEIATSMVHGVGGTVVGTTDVQTLSGKTLTAPIIASFANANHDHAASVGGANIPATSITGHAAAHIKGGSVEVDGDKLDIDWNPAATEYAPDSSPAEAGDVDHLTAHLKGIATALGLRVKAVYAWYYGGVVTLVSGSDTVLTLGVTVLQSAGLSVASDIVTVSPAVTALAFVASAMVEATVTGDAQVSMQVEQDPATGTFAVMTSTRVDTGINSADTEQDRDTLVTFGIAVPGNNYRYRLTGRIQSGAATVKTVAAGIKFMVFGVGPA